MVQAFYSSQPKPKDFELGEDPELFRDHEEIGIRDLGRLISQTSRSNEAAVLCHESYKKGSWQGGVNLFEWGNLSGESGRNCLSNLVLCFRRFDVPEDVETGEQKWLLVAGKTSLILCTSGQTFLIDESTMSHWSRSPLALEEWTDADLSEFIGDIQSVNIALRPSEDDLLSSIVYQYGVDVLVEDPDFEEEVERNSPLGPSNENWFSWNTNLGFKVYLHFGDYTHYFHGPISPNFGSTFRRLLAWVTNTKMRLVIGGEVDSYPVLIEDNGSELEVALRENDWLATGEPLWGGLTLWVSSPEIKDDLLVSLKAFKLDSQISWLALK